MSHDLVLPSGGATTRCRKITVLSSLRSPLQMNFAPSKSCSKNGFFGPTSSWEYSLALPQVESSKSIACQFFGIGIDSVRGFAVSPSIGPQKNSLAFHFALVTVPSPSLRMKPPSPIWVLLYSIPVFASALSLAITARVIG